METPLPHDPVPDAQKIRQLIESQKSLLLSTSSAERMPEISYAPYVTGELGRFYIYTSQLAQHTRNLLENPKASILFIEPELGCKNLFARERVVIHCGARIVPPDAPVFGEKLQALEDRFGSVAALIRTLPDFRLFELSPESGHYVGGFGKAYALDCKSGTLKPLGR